MKIICAASVLYGREAFSTVGDVSVIPDAEISSGDICTADALITRSKTKVDRTLLAGSAVKFVGTATAGFDHFDLPYLLESGIAWTQAPGCNANSVAEYVVAALLYLANRHGFSLEDRTLGVIGVGQVGSRVVRKAEALGITVLQNDPPLRAKTGDAVFLPLDDLLRNADIVTLHVPLTDDGPWPTAHMADLRFFSQLNPGTIFINAARGEVVDTSALSLALERGVVTNAILDVWENEPTYDAAMLGKVDLGTPHIAGYSLDGKLKGTIQIYRELCHYFEIEPPWVPPQLVPPTYPVVEIDVRGLSDDEALREVVRRAYDIESDDRRLRETESLPIDERGKAFSDLRRNYPARREFPAISVSAISATPQLQKKIKNLGFQLMSA